MKKKKKQKEKEKEKKKANLITIIITITMPRYCRMRRTLPQVTFPSSCSAGEEGRRWKKEGRRKKEKGLFGGEGMLIWGRAAGTKVGVGGWSGFLI